MKNLKRKSTLGQVMEQAPSARDERVFNKEAGIMKHVFFQNSSWGKAFAVRLIALLSLISVFFTASTLLLHAQGTEQNGLNFDGSNDVVDADNLAVLNGVSQYTIESWVRFDSFATWCTVFAKRTGDSDRAAVLQCYGSGGELGVAVNGGYGYTSAPLSTATWYHLAIVFDGSQATDANRLKLYVDGLPASLTFLGAVPTITPNTASRFALGAEYNGTAPISAASSLAAPFAGTLDELRVWSYARSQAQIQSDMNHALLGTESGLEVYYNFNQGTAGGNNTGLAVLTDTAGKAHNGVLWNFALTGSASNWIPGVVVTATPTNTPTPTPTSTSTPTPTPTATPSGGVCVPAHNLVCGGSDTRNNSNPGSTNQITTYSCTGWNESGPEYAYQFIPDTSGQVTVALSNMTVDLDIFILNNATGNCTAGNCITYGDTSAVFNASSGQTYYLLVDGFTGAVGNYTINVQCSGTPTPTPTPTATLTPTSTATPTPTATPTATPTNTPTNTPTVTPTATSVGTPTNTPTATPTSVPTETRTVGVINITADTFIDLGGGRTLARGNVRLGERFFLVGPADQVLFDANTVEGYGLLALGQGAAQLPILFGSFRAAGADGLVAPEAGTGYLLRVAGFALADPILQIHLDTGLISGSGNLRIAPPGVSETANAQFNIRPGTLITSSPIVTGFVSLLHVGTSGVTLDAAAVPLSSDGLYAPTAQLTLPPELGGLRVDVQNLAITPDSLGLGNGLDFGLPDMIFGDGSHLTIKNNRGVLFYEDSDQEYRIAINGTMTLTLPENSPQTLSVNVTLEDEAGQATLRGSLDHLTLKIAQATLDMETIQIGTNGLNVAAAILTLPPSLSNDSVDVYNIHVAPNGHISIGSAAAVFHLPDIRVGDGRELVFRQGVASVAYMNSEYRIDATGILSVTLPENSQSITASVSIAKGELDGRVDRLDVSVAGLTLTMQNAAFVVGKGITDGVSVDVATLAMPPEFGNATATITNVRIDDTGLHFANAGVGFDVPNLAFGQAFALVNNRATLDVLRDFSGYRLTANGTLSITLPENAQARSISFTLSGDPRRDFVLVGQLDRLTLNVAGSTLDLTGLTLGNQGFLVQTAVLTLPVSLGGRVQTLANIALTRTGLQIGQGEFELPDLKFAGGQIDIIDPYATLAISSSLYRLSARGTLSATLPENKITGALQFDIASGGQLTGTLANLRLNLAGLTLTLQQSTLSNDGLAARNARLQAPDALGGVTAQVDQVRVTKNGLDFGAANVTANLPPFQFGSTFDFTRSVASLNIISATLGHKYQLAIASTLDVNLPDNDQQQGITLTMIYTSSGGYDFDGKVSGLNLDLAGVTLSIGPLDIRRDGLYADSATLFVPTELGGLTATVRSVSVTRADKLKFADAEILLPDLTFGTAGIRSNDLSRYYRYYEYPPLALRQNRATLQELNNHYVLTVHSQVNVALPENSLSTAIDFTLQKDNGRYQISGTLGQLVLVVGGGTLTMTNTTLGNTGFTVAHAVYALPPSLGGQATVDAVQIISTGLSIGNLTLPDIVFGGAGDQLSITGASASLSAQSGVFKLNGQGTLRVSIPNNAFTTTVQFSMLQSQISATLTSLNLTVAGSTLALQNIGFDNVGMHAQTAMLTLPPRLGSEAVTVYQVDVTRHGLSIGGGSFTMPRIKFGDGSKLAISNPTASLAVMGQDYMLAVSGTLNINLPQNTQNIAVAFHVDKNGDMSGSIDQVRLTVAGSTLTLTQSLLSTTGLTVTTALLQLPAKLGGEAFAVNSVAVTAAGLSIGGGSFTMRDIKLGGDQSKFEILQPTAVITHGADGYTFTIAGQLVISLPQNSGVSAYAQATIDPNGELHGSVPNLTLMAANLQLDLVNASVTTQTIAVSTATLRLPAKLGGGSGTLYNVQIDHARGLTFGGGAASVPVPDFKIGGSTGLDVTQARMSLSLAADKTYNVAFAGTVGVQARGSSGVAATGIITMDSANNLTGQLTGFAVDIVGLTLGAQNAQIVSDMLTIAQASLAAPQAWGGESADVYNVHINLAAPYTVTIGGGDFNLPAIHAGGFTLQLKGGLVPVDGGYEISAGGAFGVPSLNATSSCGIGLNATLFLSGTATYLKLDSPDEAGALKTASLRPLDVDGLSARTGLASDEAAGVFSRLHLRNVSAGMYGCDIPIGTTGFALSRVAGSLSLDGGTTTVQLGVTVESIALKLPIVGSALSGDVDATLQVGDQLTVTLAGALKVFGWQAAQSNALIARGEFSGTLNIHLLVANGSLNLNTWNDSLGFHITGQGTADIGIHKGAILGWWPQCDHIFASTAIEFGEFKTPSQATTWGFMGQVEIYQNLNWTAFVDEDGALKLNDVKAYQLVGPSQVLAAQDEREKQIAGGRLAVNAPWRSGEVTVWPPSADEDAPALPAASPDVQYSVNFTQSQAVVFHLTTSDPTNTSGANLWIKDPNGNWVCQNRTDAFYCNMTAMIEHKKSVACPGDSSAATTYDEYWTVEVFAGTWQVDLYKLPQAPVTYQSSTLGKWPPAPVLTSARLTDNGNNTGSVAWNLQAYDPGTVVDVYIDPWGPFGPRLIAQGLPTRIDNTLNTYSIDLNAQSTNWYYVLLSVRDNVNKPVQLYAQNSSGKDGWITVYHPWGSAAMMEQSPALEIGGWRLDGQQNVQHPISNLQFSGVSASRLPDGVQRVQAGWDNPHLLVGWDADLEVTADYHRLAVNWDRYANPDADGYVLYVGERPGLANALAAMRVITAGNTTAAVVQSLAPGRMYYLAVKAYDVEGGQSVLSDEIEARTLTPEFDLAGPGAVTVVGGGQARAVVTLTTLLATYPDVVGLSVGCAQGRPSFKVYLPLVIKSGATNLAQAQAVVAVDCASLDGLDVTFVPPLATPTISGTQVQVVVSATDSLPGGVYRVPVQAHFAGGSVTRDVEVSVTVLEPRYALTVTPNVITLTEGQSTQVTVSASSLNGESDLIRLRLQQGAPAGLRGSFAPELIAAGDGKALAMPGTLVPGGSATLTLTDTEALDHGLYPLNIVGDDGEYRETVALVLNIVKPNFHVEVNAPSPVVAGGAAVYEANVLADNGWTLPVTLTLDPASVPPHVTYGFLSGPMLPTGEIPVGQTSIVVNPPARVYVVLITSQGSPVGLYLLRAQATGGDVRYVRTLSLRIVNPPAPIR